MTVSHDIGREGPLGASAIPDSLRSSGRVVRLWAIYEAVLARTASLFDELGALMRRHMIAALPIDNTCTLKGSELRSLQTVYATWRGRVPAAVPRRIHLSADLLENPIRHDYGDGLAAVLREIARGETLQPRLSTDIDYAYSLQVPPRLESHRRRRQRRHLDQLLADWNIHHLHLGTGRHPRRPEFVERKPHVLLVAFVGGDAYPVDLRGHERDGDNWSALRILETVVRNWPDAGIVCSSDYATGLVAGNHGDEGRRALRASGVSVSVEIDGRVWSGGGQTITGSPMHIARHCMATSWLLSGYDPTEGALRAQLSAKAEEHGVPNEWRARIRDEAYGFASHGVLIQYGSLVPWSSLASKRLVGVQSATPEWHPGW